MRLLEVVNVHLLHTTDNHSSLVDEYNKLIKTNDNYGPSGENYVPKQVDDETSAPKRKRRGSASGGFFARLFGG